MKTLNIEKHRLIVIAFLFSLLLSGCTGAGTPTASPTVTLLPTATALPTATPTMAPTATAEPTETAGAAAQVVASGDRAAFVSETYPDNSVLDAGESFTKAFELRNAGNETWTTDYALVRDETTPAGETLGAAERLALPQAVGPGDGVQRVWATIRVCADGQDCSAPVVAAGGPSASGVSLTFVEVTHEGGMIFVEYCVTVENPGPSQKYPTPMNRSITIDGEEIASPGMGSAYPVYDPVPGYSCVRERPPVTSETFNQAGSVILRIGKVEGTPIDTDAICEDVKPVLMTQYPGLDFQCDFDSGNYYTGLQLPAGMTREQAHLLIVDAIKGTIYGPWDLTIK